MKLTLLTEGLSDILYHYRSISSARNILSTNEFRLSPDLVDHKDEKHRHKGKIYFLSTTRSKSGGYHQMVPSGVIFVLDGRKLMADGYSGKPVNYFTDITDSDYRTEAEDRVYSNDPTIGPASKYIQEVHIFKGNLLKTHYTDIWAVAMIASKFARVFLYDDPQSFYMLDTRKARKASKESLQDYTNMESSDQTIPLNFPDKEGYQSYKRSVYTKKEVPTRIKMLAHLMTVSKDHLNPEIVKQWVMEEHFPTMAYSRRALRSVIERAHKSKDPANRKYLTQIIAVMKDNGLKNIGDMIGYINDKVKSI